MARMGKMMFQRAGGMMDSSFNYLWKYNSNHYRSGLHAFAHPSPQALKCEWENIQVGLHNTMNL